MSRFLSVRARSLFLALLSLFISFFWLLSVSTARSYSPAAAGDVYDLIAQVNSLRASSGLPALEIDASLMAAAQGHSEYQAANQSITHTGAGGSTPKSRAVAAGYGGGQSLFVTENIAGGAGMDAARAVQIWQGDALHLNTMLHPSGRDVGAGMASDGKTAYYTLVVGYISGQGSTGSQPAPSATAPAGSTPAPRAGFVVATVITVTPQGDGSIIHTVLAGEVLMNIAEAYKIKLSDLLQMNGLTDKAVIYPGQKLKIKGPDPTATSTATTTPTKIPTATRRPTRTPTPSPTLPIATATNTPAAASSRETGSTGDPLLISIAVLLVIGVGLMFLGVVFRRRQPPAPKKPPQEPLE